MEWDLRFEGQGGVEGQTKPADLRDWGKPRAIDRDRKIW